MCGDGSEILFNIAELVRLVISYIKDPGDLLNCACLNQLWNKEAMSKLYEGSLNDMKLRTPDIGSLNCLLVASPKRFAAVMSHVEHLLICPERPAEDDRLPGDWSETRNQIGRGKLICSEKFRAFLDRKRGEALLRPNGRTPLSIAIPFPLIDQDLSKVSEFIFHPQLKSLTIDDMYCTLMLSELRRLQKLTGTNKLLDLKSLSVYHSSRVVDFDALCGVLQLLDLEFFQLGQATPDGRRANSAKGVLRSLRNHNNLQGLALMTPRLKIFAFPDGLDPTQRLPLPELKALYLLEVIPNMRDFIADFEQLQILEIRSWAQRQPARQRQDNPHFLVELAEVIQSLPNLKAVDILIQRDYGDARDDNFRDAQFLLDLANGCPSLQKLRLRASEWCLDSPISEEEFSTILKSLPHIQWLAFDFTVHFNDHQLRILADYCPQIAFLELEKGQLFLSDGCLAEMPPLYHLKHMRLEHLWFENPRPFWSSDGLEGLAMEWSRVFPRLVESPCLRDIKSVNKRPYGHLYRRGSKLDPNNNTISPSRANDENSTGDKAEPIQQPDFFSSEPDLSYLLRLNLWHTLGYGRDGGAFLKARHMWQTQFEIDTFGWPVMPVQAFVHPLLYSSSSKPAVGSVIGPASLKRYT